jgi:colanic acid biosynthesis glycosyl transferase WcaI
VRILILALNYLPESTSIGPYTADLAEYLAGRGYDVRVVTAFPSAPLWKIWPEYRGRWHMSETIRRVKIRRTYIYVPSNPRRSVQRIFFDLSFSVSAFIASLLSGRCDLIMAISPPLQLGLAAWLSSRYHGVPFVLHIQDIVSEAAVATGSLRPETISHRIARTMERFLYKHADGIGVICEGFRRAILKSGADPRKVRILPNYVDLDFIRPCEQANEFRRQHGLSPDDFVLMYSGSISSKQGLEVLIEAAGFVSDPAIKVVIIGGGSRLLEIQSLASALRLANVVFLPLQPRETLSSQLGAADLLVITQKPTVKDVVFPGKLLYYMAAQRPILAIVNADSETGRFVASERVGVVVPPDNPETVALAIMQLRSHSLTELGRNARSAVERYFDKKIVLPEFDDLLTGLVARIRGDI